MARRRLLHATMILGMCTALAGCAAEAGEDAGDVQQASSQASPPSGGRAWGAEGPGPCGDALLMLPPGMKWTTKSPGAPFKTIQFQVAPAVGAAKAHCRIFAIPTEAHALGFGGHDPFVASYAVDAFTTTEERRPEGTFSSPAREKVKLAPYSVQLTMTWNDYRPVPSGTAADVMNQAIFATLVRRQGSAPALHLAVVQVNKQYMEGEADYEATPSP